MHTHKHASNTIASLFSAPQTGRTITAGFSYLQRIGKHATTNIWLEETIKRFTPKDTEWAAIRQFELLQESDNLAIDELDITNMNKSHDVLMSMRAGGYRMTLIMLGTYEKDHWDELALADQRIQQEIAQLINFLYLDELSEHETKRATELLKHQTWNYETALPHIVKALGERQLFQPHKMNQKEKLFFEILQRLHKNHIVNETAVGLVLPDAKKVKNWTYIPDEENRFTAFHSTINSALRNVGEDMAVMKHMRGYGDHMHASIRPFNKQALQILKVA